uniref:Xaa-Pro aminopeptidase ApepP (Trinotate prediction) n=1 Tax=Henneguya salminicola TaxID=69463 RepID=A0A6G3MJP9_HENSL
MPQVPTTHLLSKLRKLFGINNSLNPIHAYIITSNDCHTSEYTSDSDKRRQFISGFAGSAGTAVITPTGAFLWTDPRYFLEAKDCLDENWHLMKLGLPETPSILDWLKKLPHGSVVGTDPHYLSYTQWKIYQKVGIPFHYEIGTF